MTISSDDFFDLVVDEDVWGGPSRTVETLNIGLLSSFGKAPDPEHTDPDVAVALLDLVRDDLTRSGTGKDPRLSDTQMRLAIRTLNQVMARAGQDFSLPFRDHASWKEWWLRQGAKNSYQARRDLLHDLFNAAMENIETAEAPALFSASPTPTPTPTESHLTASATDQHRDELPVVQHINHFYGPTQQVQTADSVNMHASESEGSAGARTALFWTIVGSVAGVIGAVFAYFQVRG